MLLVVLITHYFKIMKRENFINNFVKTNQQLCETAFNEGWIGEPWDRGMNGLLGYMRYSYNKQSLILNGEPKFIQVPNFYNYTKEIIEWFKSNNFKDQINDLTRSFAFIYNKNHFDLLKKIKVEQIEKITFTHFCNYINKIAEK